jgi:hypothetical protein
MSAYEGFPKFYSHKNKAKPNRVAHTPTDAVNLEAAGYKLNETKGAEKTLDAVAKADAEAAKTPGANKPSASQR